MHWAAFCAEPNILVHRLYGAGGVGVLAWVGRVGWGRVDVLQPHSTQGWERVAVLSRDSCEE